MVRRIAAGSAAVLVVLATAASAGPRPQVTDPKGDWHVPSQDVLSGTLSTDRSGALVVALRVAAPIVELPGHYHVVMYRGCDTYVARLDWRGPALPPAASLETSRWCAGTIVPGLADVRPNPRTSVPATATVAGDTVTWTLPATPGLAKGARIDGVVAIVTPNPELPVGVTSYTTGVPTVRVEAFDIGYGNRGYVVGG